MEEIKEKDLEKASGGAGALSSGCDKFEAKNKTMARCPRICGLCMHYVIAKGVCGLEKYKGEHL